MLSMMESYAAGEITQADLWERERRAEEYRRTWDRVQRREEMQSLVTQYVVYLVDNGESIMYGQWTGKMRLLGYSAAQSLVTALRASGYSAWAEAR